MDREQVVERLKRGQGERSLRKYAKDLGVSVAYMSDIYRGRRDPGPAILAHFGLKISRKISTSYVKTGDRA